MDNIPTHMRITGLTVTNEDVDSRRKAVAELSASWGKISDVDTIVAKAAEVALSLTGVGTPPSDLGGEVETVVQKSASAFLTVEKPLEVGICAGMALISVMQGEPGTSGWTIPDVYSNALWSALGFQAPLADEKREALRLEVLNRARERSLVSANKARQRDAVPELGDLSVSVAEDGKVTHNLKKALSAPLEVLTRNAALDREELDFLWWVQTKRSKLLGKPLASIPEAVRLVAVGIEGGGHLRRLPADVHREIVLGTLDEDPVLSLNALLEQLGDDRSKLVSGISIATVNVAPTVFPLLHALGTGVADLGSEDRERPASEWATRALLETGLARMSRGGVKKL